MVTFDIDANGILNVTAKDNSTGKVNNIQIKNDKGRLSKEEIEKMLRDADKYRTEDEQQKERVSAKNRLESYIFSLKQAVNDAQSISVSDRKTVEDTCIKELKWLENNQTADKEEFDFHYNELSRRCSPIMSRVHRNQSRNDTNGYANNSGPTVEEVD